MRRLAVACLWVVWLSACGDRGIALENLDEEVVKSYCASGIRCGFLPAGTDCAALVPDTLGQLRASVKAGRIRYDGVAASDCLAAFAADACSLSATGSTASCDKTFTGTVNVGDPCLVDDECVSRACDMPACNDTIQCCRGTCAVGNPEVAVGGDCSLGTSTCVEGSICQRSTTATQSTCVALPGEGESCLGLGLCKSGLGCAVSTTSVQEVCTRFPKRGETCSDQLRCDSSRDFCDPATSKCVTRGDVGAACVGMNDCLGYSFCDETTHTCVANQGLGGSCAAGEVCLYLLTCHEGTCQKVTPDPVCP